MEIGESQRENEAGGMGWRLERLSERLTGEWWDGVEIGESQ